MVKRGNINSGIPTRGKKVPIIPLGYNCYALKNNPTNTSSTSLRTETRRMYKKSLTDFQSKEKELSSSSIGVESSRVPTEVDYSARVDPRPTQEELNNMGN